MTYRRLRSTDNEILDDLYKKVFKKFLFYSSYIFLCGANVNKKDFFRKSLNKKLSKQFSDIKVIYPENIFKDYLKNNPKKDMLELETILASNADAICIIHESEGSFVELGAFTYDKKSKYFDRVIVLTKNEFKNKKSFINQGPIKRVKNKYESHQLIYQESDIKEPSQKFVENLYAAIKDVKKSNRPSKQYCLRITNLVGLAYFILIYLYIKNDESINLFELKTKLNNFYKNNAEIANYNSISKRGKNVNAKIFHAAICFLIEQEKFANINDKKTSIKINNNGLNEISRLIDITKKEVKNLENSIECIKLANLEQTLYNQN